MASARPVSREILVFAAIGVGGLFVDMGALWLALRGLGLGRHPWGVYPAGLFSYFIAATFTWWANRQFNFQGASRRAALRQWLTFLSANGVGAVVNNGVYTVVVAVGTPAFVAAALPWVPGLWPYGAKAAGSLSGMVFNFTLSKRLVFKRNNTALRGR